MATINHENPSGRHRVPPEKDVVGNLTQDLRSEFWHLINDGLREVGLVISVWFCRGALAGVPRGRVLLLRHSNTRLQRNGCFWN